jgi:hypothetical protein
VDPRTADSERAPPCASCLGTTSAPTAALWKAWKAAAGDRRKVGGEDRIQRRRSGGGAGETTCASASLVFYG